MQVLKDEVQLEILRQARQEFLAKGYREASLRAITQGAGMTVGNIYRYFASKDALFRELLAPVIGQIEMMKMALRQHAAQEHEPSDEAAEHEQMVLLVYNFIRKHRDDLKLLLSGAGGSSLENFREELINWYGAIYRKYMEEAWKFLGQGELQIHERTIYLISQSVEAALIECIIHDYSLEEVKQVAEEMFSFFSGGSRQIIEDKLKMKNER
ncbi:MAG: TetR/AcrR family transcriptional regulator [Candidatus Cloacimonetes bacterium]|nr:TetR/AcrR family transcriptional regulator [Candidatus Cloacimonadota bacterium]